MNSIDPETVQRTDRLRRMMNKMIRTMPPWQRDRLMQEHLAQVRGAKGNAQALRVLMNHLIRMRQGKVRRVESHDE